MPIIFNIQVEENIPTKCMVKGINIYKQIDNKVRSSGRWVSGWMDKPKLMVLVIPLCSILFTNIFIKKF